MAQNLSPDRYDWRSPEQYPTPPLSRGFSRYGSAGCAVPAPGTGMSHPQDNQTAAVLQPPLYWNNASYPSLNQSPVTRQTYESPAIGLGISAHGYQHEVSSYSPEYQAPPPFHDHNSFQSQPYPQIFSPGPQSNLPLNDPRHSCIPPSHYSYTSPYEQAANAPCSTPIPNPTHFYPYQRPYENQPFQQLTGSFIESNDVSSLNQGWRFPPQLQNYKYRDNRLGHRRALLIGINYLGQTENFKELKGAINDAKRVQDFLVQNYGYQSNDIVVLTDDSPNPLNWPTKANIENEMQRLVTNSVPGDSLFFHFSGHGSQTDAKYNDEEDGMDEIILPVDWEANGYIDDNYMHAIMVQPLRHGVRLTAIFDSCHSGTALDLHYIYRPDGKIKAPTQNWKDWSHEALKAYRHFSPKALSRVKNNVERTRSSYELSRETKIAGATVVMLSGAKDSQNAKDTIQDGQYVGAMSWAFTTALTKKPQQSYLELLQNVRYELRSNHYTQTPQLSCSHDLDTSAEFVL